MPKLIDAHTHTQFAAYGDDTEKVVECALDNNIWVVNVGTQKNTSRLAVELSEKYSEGVYATIGLHPIHTNKSYHDIQELGGGESAKAFTSSGEEFDYDFYKKLGKNEKVVAVGECGLDYYRLEEDTKDRQIDALEAQIKLAKDLDVPIMVHCRDAFADLIDVLKRNENNLREIPGISHFFAGNIENAKALIEIGFYFTFGGVITFTHDYDEIVKYIGLDRIMLETDAPYVAPEPFRGKRNEPAYLEYTAKKLAEILEKDFDEIAEKTVENTRKVLNI
jgi:TatD DNase family protein